ncbi:MAG: sulfate permease [Ilumatobacteraceae bacterium]
MTSSDSRTQGDHRRRRALVGDLLPGAMLLRRYQRQWLRPDLTAGLTVGAMLIPQSMGYAELAGMAPQYGFYAVIGALVVYAVVGSSRHLGVGPEPGTAILAASGVAAIANGDGGRYVTLMAALALVVAAICLVAAALRLGYLASMLSKPVLVGYITGVGLTLFSSQLGTLTGASIEADSFFPRCWQFLHRLGQVHGPTVAIGLAALCAILLLKWKAPQAPAALIGVVLATSVTAMWSLGDHGVALVGEIPKGLPTPGFPSASLHDLALLLPIAAGIALVGFSDNVLTARAIAASRGYRIDPNQELLALGLINLTAGVSHGFPISSSASRTAVPASLGSRTQLVSLIASAFVVASLLLLRPALAEIPRTALAAVILVAAITIIDFDGFVSLWHVNRGECVIAVSAALGVIVLGVLYGIVIAVALSIAVALGSIARPHDAVLGNMPGLDGWVDVGEYPTALTASGLLVFRFDAPLIFMNTERFRDRVEQALEENPGREEWFVMDCEGIGTLDASALDMLGELASTVHSLGVDVLAVTRANEPVLARLRRAGLVEPDGPMRVFPTINGAVRAFHARTAAAAAPPDGSEPESGPDLAQE